MNKLDLKVKKGMVDVQLWPGVFEAVDGEPDFKTGNRPEWEQELREKAIANKCYIIAAAQCGAHNSIDSMMSSQKT